MGSSVSAFLVLLMLAAAPAPAADWSFQTIAGGTEVEPAAAIDARGDVLIAWGEVQEGQGVHHVIAATRQPDGSFATQVVGDVAANGFGPPAVALDAAGNATVAWSDLRGMWVARHGPGEPFGQPRLLAGPGAGMDPLAAAGTSDTIVAWDGTRGDASRATIQTATWHGSAADPHFQTVVVSPYTVRYLKMNAADEAVLVWDDGFFADSHIARREPGQDFAAYGPGSTWVSAVALAPDGDALMGLQPDGDHPYVGDLRRDGDWIPQGSMTGPHAAALDASGDALFLGTPGWVGAVETVSLRPGTGEARPGPAIPASSDASIQDLEPNARGGVTGLITDHVSSGNETLGIYSRDGSGDFSPGVAFPTGFGLGGLASGPAGGELAVGTSRSPGPVIVAMRDLPAPPPPPPSPPPPATAAPPVLNLAVPQRQHALTLGRLRVALKCTVGCSVRLAAGGSSRHVKLDRPGRGASVSLRLASRVRTRLRHRAHGRVRLTAAATFSNGRRRTIHRIVRVAR